jgi:hypothetical protein
MEKVQISGRRFKLTLKEVFILSFGTALALGSFKSDDPVVVIPMLSVAGVSFIGLCWWHQGKFLWRVIAALALLIILVFIGWRDLRSQEHPYKPKVEAQQESSNSCVIEANVSSDVLARLYSRGFKPASQEVQFGPSSEEFFYEWRLDLKANCELTNVVVEIEKISWDERPKVDPDSPRVSFSTKPEWLSGFTEQRPPDFYRGIISVDVLPKDIPVSIITRLPLHKKLPVGEEEIIASLPIYRRFRITASKHARIEEHSYDWGRQPKLIANKLRILAATNYTGHGKNPLAIRDPDAPVPPLRIHEIEAILEVRCVDPECKQASIINIEARAADNVIVNFGNLNTKRP